MKILIKLLLLTFLFYTVGSSSIIFAEAPDDIKISAEKELENFKGSLGKDKEHFGLSSTDSTEGAKLGEGYPFYTIIPQALTDYEIKKQSPTIDNTFKQQGYIFPIKVGNKSAGIIYVEQREGKWKIVQISSNLTFEKDIKAAQALASKITGAKTSLDNERDRIHLIYDQSIGLSALTAKSQEGKEVIIPLKRNTFLSLSEQQDESLTTVIDKISKIKQEQKSDSEGKNGGIGGTNTGIVDQTESKSTNFIYIALIACIVLVVSFFVLRKLKKN